TPSFGSTGIGDPADSSAAFARDRARRASLRGRPALFRDLARARSRARSSLECDTPRPTSWAYRSPPGCSLLDLRNGAAAPSITGVAWPYERSFAQPGSETETPSPRLIQIHSAGVFEADSIAW